MAWMLSVPWMVVSMPIRLLWRAYLGLWWAFDDGGRVAGSEGRSTGKAFEVVDGSPPPRAVPKGALRRGFVSSLGAAVSCGVVLTWWGVLEGWPGVAGWAWLTAASMVVSAWLVRRRMDHREGDRRSWGGRVSAWSGRIWRGVRGVYVRQPASHSGQRGAAGAERMS